MMYRIKTESRIGVSLSGKCCVVCGWKKTDHRGNLLVEGAHVRGYKRTPDYDKRDNIIGLCPNHHTEFDIGNFTIDPKSKTIIHINKNDEYHNKKTIGKINHIKPGYFDYHKIHVFKGRMKN